MRRQCFSKNTWLRWSDRKYAERMIRCPQTAADEKDILC